MYQSSLQLLLRTADAIKSARGKSMWGPVVVAIVGVQALPPQAFIVSVGAAGLLPAQGARQIARLDLCTQGYAQQAFLEGAALVLVPLVKRVGQCVCFDLVGCDICW